MKKKKTRRIFQRMNSKCIYHSFCIIHKFLWDIYRKFIKNIDAQACLLNISEMMIGYLNVNLVYVCHAVVYDYGNDDVVAEFYDVSVGSLVDANQGRIALAVE